MSRRDIDVGSLEELCFREIAKLPERTLTAAKVRKDTRGRVCEAEFFSIFLCGTG